MLPFHSLYIDEFESLVMAVAQVQKINNEYFPPLRSSPCRLNRIVKYFKGVNEFQELQNPQSKLTIMLKSSFLSSQTYHKADESESQYNSSAVNGNDESMSESSKHVSVGTNNTIF